MSRNLDDSDVRHDDLFEAAKVIVDAFSERTFDDDSDDDEFGCIIAGLMLVLVVVLACAAWLAWERYGV